MSIAFSQSTLYKRHLFRNQDKYFMRIKLSQTSACKRHLFRTEDKGRSPNWQMKIMFLKAPDTCRIDSKHHLALRVPNTWEFCHPVRFISLGDCFPAHPRGDALECHLTGAKHERTVVPQNPWIEETSGAFRRA